MNTQDIQPSLSQKIFLLDDLIEQVRQWKKQGASIGFTNGVFDILHLGHVNYLADAASRVDHLILAVNSDSSVRRLNKGPERPINSEESRSYVLAALESVSAVCIFEEDTPLSLIAQVEPDVLMKGGDYDPECSDEKDRSYIVGSKEVHADGGKVVSIPLVEGFSTTDLVKKLRRDGN